MTIAIASATFPNSPQRGQLEQLCLDLHCTHLKAITPSSER
jgi:hypothetical protein